MHKTIKLAVIVGSIVVAGHAFAQTPAPPPAPPQFPNVTFFITSTGGPAGANYGGLEGADKHCQTLAATAGAGSKTWRAYLSTQAVTARRGERARPHWQGAVVQRQRRADRGDVDDLHSANNKMTTDRPHREQRRSPKGRRNTGTSTTSSPARTPMAPPSAGERHDLRQLDEERRRRRDGRSLRPLRAATTTRRRHGTRHTRRVPAAASLIATGGAGLLYCFAAN